MSDHITECIVSFLFTLALIAWDVLELIHGRAGAMTWVFLPILSIIGLFEIGAICEARKKGHAVPEKTTEV
ncbi:MAG: hypothetical protein IKI84_08190 [Clostridia bacterium]|nr:hypothetical protein [Clostridia bacterium]